MKKVLLVLALVTSVPAFALVARMGGSYSTSDPEKVFIRIKNSGSGSVPRGCIMAVDTSADDGVSYKANGLAGQLVTCVTEEAISAGQFGLCQVYGLHGAVLVRGDQNAVTAGSRIQSGAQACYGDGGSATNSNFVGIALDSTSSSTTVKAFLQVM